VFHMVSVNNRCRGGAGAVHICCAWAVTVSSEMYAAAVPVRHAVWSNVLQWCRCMGPAVCIIDRKCHLARWCLSSFRSGWQTAAGHGAYVNQRVARAAMCFHVVRLCQHAQPFAYISGISKDKYRKRNQLVCSDVRFALLQGMQLP
jgi:hypothetical protein